MSKGPRINNISKNFTTRDNLGIEGVATSISAEICPVVNTVTPRPFYWAFICWCYYDYYKNYSKENRSIENVNKYIKMQNYFLCVAAYLNNKNVINGFSGSDNIKNMIDRENSSFSYNEKYLQTTLGNMVYYPTGLYTMGFLIDENPDTHNKFSYPHLTVEGEKLAKSFDLIISQTQYYKYRHQLINIEKNVLIELSNFITIDLEKFEETKEILRNHLFNKKALIDLAESKKYLELIFEIEKINSISVSDCRKYFFDMYSEKGDYKKDYPIDLKNVIESWEIVVGRQYFTTALEIIWKYMLENLDILKYPDIWFEDCIKNSKFEINLNDTLDTIIDDCNYTFEERENMLLMSKRNNSDHSNNIQNGLKIIISIYNRFYGRVNLSDRNNLFFNYGIESNSISLNQFFELVNEYKNKTIKEFILFLMEKYLLQQHLKTAFNKMMQKPSRDGYYIEEIDNQYIRKNYIDVDFQGIRMVQLASVMKDLDIIKEK